MAQSMRNKILVAVCAYIALKCVLACKDRCSNSYGGGYALNINTSPLIVEHPPSPSPAVVGRAPSPHGNGSVEAPKGSKGTCPVDVVKLGVCSPLLGILGIPSSSCCALLGVLGVDANICLCLALDKNVLGLIDIHIPHLDLIASILTSCDLPHPPSNFSCPNT